MSVGLVWSGTPPTIPGWYWKRNGTVRGNVEIVRVDRAYGDHGPDGIPTEHLQAWISRGDGDKDWRFYIAPMALVHLGAAQWAGPIPTPTDLPS